PPTPRPGSRNPGWSWQASIRSRRPTVTRRGRRSPEVGRQGGGEVVQLASGAGRVDGPGPLVELDRKSTRLNSSHVKISYAVLYVSLLSHPDTPALLDAHAIAAGTPTLLPKPRVELAGVDQVPSADGDEKGQAFTRGRAAGRW